MTDRSIVMYDESMDWNIYFICGQCVMDDGQLWSNKIEVVYVMDPLHVIGYLLQLNNR